MRAFKPFTSQPPLHTPIAAEFADGLVAAFEGHLSPSVRKMVTVSPTRIRLGAETVATASTGVNRGYPVSSSFSTAITNALVSEALVEFASGSSFTFMARVSGPAFAGTNPGFWRSQSDELGNTFCIVEGLTLRPWIRINGTDVLRPSTGAIVPTTANLVLDILYRFGNGSFADVWWGGLKRHTVTTSATLPSLTGTSGIYTIGRQNVTEYVNGTYAAIRFWKRALTDAQCARLTRNPWEFYAPMPGRLLSPVASSPAFLAAWASAANSVIQSGVRAA